MIIVEPVEIRLKKMKSTLPDVGKMKSELKAENDKLRNGTQYYQGDTESEFQEEQL